MSLSSFVKRKKKETCSDINKEELDMVLRSIRLCYKALKKFEEKKGRRNRKSVCLSSFSGYNAGTEELKDVRDLLFGQFDLDNKETCSPEEFAIFHISNNFHFDASRLDLLKKAFKKVAGSHKEITKEMLNKFIMTGDEHLTKAFTQLVGSNFSQLDIDSSGSITFDEILSVFALRHLAMLKRKSRKDFSHIIRELPFAKPRTFIFESQKKVKSSLSPKKTSRSTRTKVQRSKPSGDL